MPQIPNGIGQFIIGQSSIGDHPFDYTQTLYSQYANSPVLVSWVDYFSQWIDANKNVDMFYDQLWNIQTAQGYGLDVWGRIVGLNPGRVLPVFPTPFFGFSEAGNTPGISNDWNNAIWFAGEPLTQNVSLSDDAFRQLILAKAAANIWNGSIPGLNAILRLLFPGQLAYVTDGLNMTMTYTFGFSLNPVQISIVFNANVLPRPSGVSATVIQL